MSMDELKVKYDIDVVPSTIYNALDAICFTCKKIHSEPSEMNSSRVTSELCDSEAAHTLSFHARALDLEDMPVGSK
ncbi:hypothetical protein L915_11302 [Phytophthora nicotianae]|uniref:Uncharacterized protein n=1 Tax=Phytophthora nicotianae TaxID=4792 RepID=W2GKH8_PHYNI|nr:hypothetical protein L915_11302 [Phytophthora nicotianae]